MSAVPDLREQVGAVLGHLHALTGDGSFARARSALTGGKPGRPEIDDTQALAYARRLVETGMVKSRNAACRRVAVYFGSAGSVEAMRKRLMRKYGRNN